MHIVPFNPVRNSRALSPWEELFQIPDFNDLHYFPVAVDLFETADAVQAELSVPGVKPEDINIKVEKDVLIITGKSQKEETEEKREYYQKQIRYGSFTQTVALPCAVQAEKAEASFSSGLLKIRLPKAEEAKPKQIEIKVSDSQK